MSDHKSMWPLYHAIQEGRREDAIRLLESDEQLVCLVTRFGSWLHVAAWVGDREIVRYLVAKGCDVNNLSGILGGSAINLAAANGHASIVEYLLQSGAVLDTSEPERNPLFSAIYGGHLEVVKLLLAHGIDWKVRYTGSRMKDMDAIAYARQRGQFEIVRFLESH